LFDSLVINSPKRNSHSQTGWSGFFPYYAGFPEGFARSVLESANLPNNAIVLDPWNGSGTTTYAASQLGYSCIGVDLNPVMVIVARARLLPASEADSLEPQARKLIKGVKTNAKAAPKDDPLLWWFTPHTAGILRSVEKRIREHLVGEMTITIEGTRLDRISGFAATFYVALFAVCRELAAPYRSSNPTWLRKPKKGERRISASRDDICAALIDNICSMSAALAARATPQPPDSSRSKVILADTPNLNLGSSTVDLVLTSPPYCTRIDYTAATRVELAILHPLCGTVVDQLSRKMIGSTRVPINNIDVSDSWGPLCKDFLRSLRNHSSKASSGYYYKTHIDYFHKMSHSLSKIAGTLKNGSAAILVVQDSYYKEIHNDLPRIITEMAEINGLILRKRIDFPLKQSMARINRNSRIYRASSDAVEAVVCFEKT